MTQPTTPKELGENRVKGSQPGTAAEPELIPSETGNKLGGTTEAGEVTKPDVLYSDRPAKNSPFGEGGGIGGRCANLKLLQRAITNGWDISPEMLKDVPGWLAEIARSERDPRSRVRAAEVLVKMRGQNLEQERHEESGGVNRLDITSGGKPLGQSNLSNLSDEELERLIAERERVLPG